MFGIGFTRELERTIATRDNSLRIMKDKLSSAEQKTYEESLKVVRLAAENASLKTEINQTESRYDNMVKFKDITIGRLEKELEGYRLTKVAETPELKCKPVADKKKPVNAKLQAYYNRGKSKNK